MKLNKGDKIPHFSLIDNNGSLFRSQEVIRKKIAVIYFYPKNFTPGCTKEACSFRDSYQNFKDLGAEVIGISSDSVKSHKKFASKYDLPFIFLSDSTGEIRKKFGIKGHLSGIIPGRETFVVDKEGIVQLKFNSLSSHHHMEKAFATVKRLKNEN